MKRCARRERSWPATAHPRRAAATSATCTAFAFCAGHDLHPYRGIRRTHIELYLREAERRDPSPATATLYRRISTLSAWYRWLEDEDLHLGNPASRVRRPQRHASPQPWLNRNELTDLLAAAEDEGGHPYALTCLLGLNGLRVAEACGARIEDLAGSRYQPTLNVIGKGDKPAQIVLNPRFTSEQYREFASEGYAFVGGLTELRDVTYVDLSTSHWPMWSRPKELADIIRDIAIRVAE